MDNKTLNTLKDRVRAILEISVNSRNSDASLVANYWYKHDEDCLIQYNPMGTSPDCLAIPLKMYKDITQPSTIERARRLIQEEACLTNDIVEMGKVMPTDPKVLKRRKLNNKIWKDVINNNKIEFILNYDNQSS